MEIELKFALSADDAERLRRGPLAGAPVQEIRSVYFDTEDGALRRAGYTLRVRHEGDRILQGVKAVKGVARFERETPLEQGDPDRAALAGTPAAGIVGDAPVLPVFESRVRRVVSTLNVGEGRIELALDEGELVAGGRAAPIRELEMELKSGPPEALFEEARRWRAEHRLAVELDSKAKRGFALAAGEPRRSGKVKPPRLSSPTPAREAFHALAIDALTTFGANVRRLRAGESIEAVHQARVALRRLRAIVQAFRPVIDNEGRPAMEQAMREFAVRFGAVRDLDVFVAETFRGHARREAGAADFGCRLLRARGGARHGLCETIRSGEADDFLLGLLEWITLGAGASIPADTRRKAPTLGDIAPALLEKTWKRFRQRGEGLDWNDAAGRHRLRIQAKKLRYLADALRSALPSHKAFDRKLRRFQNAAGRLNDLHMASAVARAALGENPPEDVVFAAGEIVGLARAQEPKLIGKARKAYDALLERGPFWA